MRNFAFVGAVAAMLAYAPAALADGFKFRTFPSGEQEVTTPPGGVDSDTSGDLKLRFDRALTQAKFSLRIFDGKGITQAHLHCAPAGVNGPIVAFLYNGAPLDGTGIDVDGLLARGQLTNDDIEEPDLPFEEDERCGVVINNIASLLAAIDEDVIYLNVHSEANRSGEVRGQVFAERGKDDRGKDDRDDD